MRLTFLQKLYNSKGFTLMELMVVIAIIAGSIALVLPRISNPNNQIRATLRELMTLTRELHTRAKLQGKTYRLVFEVPEDPRSPDPAVYYVESSNKQILLRKSEDEKDYLEKRARDAKDETEAKLDPNGFSPDGTILKKKKVLPPGLTFEGLELKRAKAMLTSGKLTIHFFPAGVSEEAIVHFKAKDQVWSLIVDPMLGKSSLIGRDIRLKDIGAQ